MIVGSAALWLLICRSTSVPWSVICSRPLFGIQARIDRSARKPALRIEVNTTPLAAATIEKLSTRRVHFV
jgi:hypothetical protein